MDDTRLTDERLRELEAYAKRIYSFDEDDVAEVRVADLLELVIECMVNRQRSAVAVSVQSTTTGDRDA